jgi:hypothetical protein
MALFWWVNNAGARRPEVAGVEDPLAAADEVREALETVMVRTLLAACALGSDDRRVYEFWGQEADELSPAAGPSEITPAGRLVLEAALTGYSEHLTSYMARLAEVRQASNTAYVRPSDLSAADVPVDIDSLSISGSRLVSVSSLEQTQASF